ncbi:hypothetical protein D3C72_1486580 [compost metagenome]
MEDDERRIETWGSLMPGQQVVKRRLAPKRQVEGVPQLILDAMLEKRFAQRRVQQASPVHHHLALCDVKANGSPAAEVHSTHCSVHARRPAFMADSTSDASN